MKKRQNEQGFVLIIVGVVIVIVAIVFIIGFFTPHDKGNTSPAPIPKATTVSKMQFIHNQLSATWQVCQIDPTKCLSSVAQITSSDDVFNSVSSQYSGNALDDFTGWKLDTGLAKGDMKQWAVNEAFNKDNSLLASTIPSEIEDSQTQITSFNNDK
jgi:hypothetical protein